MKKLEWYAFMQDFNSNELVYTNIIRQSLIDRVKKAIRKNYSYEEIKEEVRRELSYRYRSKSEYEVIVSNWGSREMEEKIDIYYQVEPNLDRITEYLIRELAPRKQKKILGG